MALRDQARARESAAAAAAPPTSSAAPPAAGLPLPLPTRACPEGCTEHGNCNELTGECTCGLTRRGPACQEPTMPACMLGGRGAGAPSASPGGVDEVINLSFLVAESFWGGLRDVRTDDPRRKKVAHRWVGMVTCDCVEQAAGPFPDAHAPQTHTLRWVSCPGAPLPPLSPGSALAHSPGPRRPLALSRERAAALPRADRPHRALSAARALHRRPAAGETLPRHFPDTSQTPARHLPDTCQEVFLLTWPSAGPSDSCPAYAHGHRSASCGRRASPPAPSGRTSR